MAVGRTNSSTSDANEGGILLGSEYLSPVGVVDKSFTMPRDGHLWVSANNVNSIWYIQLSINGIETSDYSTSTSGEGNYGALKQFKGRSVKKGDVLRIYADNRGSGSHRVNYFAILLP